MNWGYPSSIYHPPTTRVSQAVLVWREGARFVQKQDEIQQQEQAAPLVQTKSTQGQGNNSPSRSEFQLIIEPTDG